MNAKNKMTLALVTVLCLSLFGFYKALDIVERLEPQVHSRPAIIYVEAPGLSSDLVYSEIVQTLEKELCFLKHVDSISSEAHFGYGVLSLDLKNTPRNNEIWRRDCEALLDVWSLKYRHMHTYVGEPVLIMDSQIGYDSVLLVPYKSLKNLEKDLRKDGVIGGYKLFANPKKQIVIEYDNEDLDQSKMHPMVFKDVIQANHTLLPGGVTHEKKRSYSVQSQSSLKSIEDLKAIPVRDPRNNDSVSLDDLVKIHASSEDKYSPEAYINGERHVVVAIQKKTNCKAHVFAERVESLAEKYSSIIYLEANSTFQSQKNATFFGVLGSIAIVFIIVLFSIGFIEAIGVAISIPLVLSISALFLSFTSVTINIVSLASIILSLSLIIDGHIVVVDASNKKKQTISEILKVFGGVLSVSMLTTLVSFSPLYFADHLLADYLSSVFIVLLVTLSVSLLYCCFVTPFFGCGKVGAKLSKTTRFFGNYDVILKKIISKKRLVIVLAVLLLLSGGLATSWLDKSFFPEQKRDYQVLSVRSKNPQTNSELRLVAQDLKSELELEESKFFIGMDAPSLSAFQPFATDDMRLISIVVPNSFKMNQCEELKGKYLNYQFELHQASVGPKIKYPLGYEVVGKLDRIEEFLSEFEVEIAKCSQIAHVVYSEGRMRTSYDVMIKADNEGDFTRQDVALALRLNTQGVPITTMNEDGDLLPVILKAEPAHHNPRVSLENAYVFSENKKVPARMLHEVATIEKIQKPATISNRNGESVVNISLYLSQNEDLVKSESSVKQVIDDLLVKYSDLEVNDQGQSTAVDRATTAIMEKVPWVIFFLVALLLLKELSIKRVLAILSILPFAFSGASIGLLLCGQSIGFMSLIGIVSLLGIVINNAILWLDALKMYNGHEEKYVRATVERFRAITITSFTGIATLAMLYGFGGEIWKPLAATLMFGLLFAYIGIIIILPVLAEIIFGRKTQTTL